MLKRWHTDLPLASMDAATARAPERPFYGWVVVGAAFTVMLVGFGVAYSFGTYFVPLRDQFGADRGSVSLVFALTGLLYFGLGSIAGPLADRLGPRPLCLAAAVMFALGLALASRAAAIWQVYLTYSLFVGCGVAATYVPAISTVQRWFLRRRALASGIAVAGIGVGTVVAPPLSGLLIDAYGWRTAYLVTGLVAGALTALAGWLLLPSPARLGLGPDGAPAAPLPAAAAATAGERTVAEAVRTRAFAWLYGAMVLATVPIFLGVAHIVPYAQDRGLGATAASLGLGAIGLGSICGRLLLAPLGDRLGRRRAYALTIGLISALSFLWLVGPLGELWGLLPWGFLFGSAYGAFVALSPTIIADYFGTAHVSGTIGVFYTGAGLGSLIGPWLGGALFDLAGSYRPAILVAALLSLAGTAAVLKAPEPEAVRAAPGRVGPPGGG